MRPNWRRSDLPHKSRKPDTFDPRAADTLRVMQRFARLASLVGDALTTGMHFFMTCEQGVLKARDSVAPLGLLPASPLDVIDQLGAAGAPHSPFEPQHLYWPMPDQQRVMHLIQALAVRENE
jgi:hypothetical protein